MVGEPKVAVIVPAVIAGEPGFPRLVESLRRSAAPYQLIVAGSAGQSGESLSRVVNDTLENLTAPFLVIAHYDGEIRPDALARMTDEFERQAEEEGRIVDLMYADEVAATVRGPIDLPKPKFSPERLRGQFYFGGLVMYRTEVVRRLGGLRNDVPGAELYDLALRAAAEGVEVVRYAREMFQVAGLPAEQTPLTDRAMSSTRVALERHLAATGGGEVVAVGADGIHETRRPLTGEPLVSIVIPTRGTSIEIEGERRSLVIDAVRSVVELSTYRNYEIVVVVDEVAEDDVLAQLTAIAGDRLSVVWWRQRFNFSGKMNLGVFHSRGDYVLFLNDDTQVISPGWIEALLALGERPEAGLVGAMLYFEDDTIQHAGHAYSSGAAGHAGTYDPRGSAGPDGSYRVEREAPGVTAACALMPRSLFDQIGGFTPLLPANFNDVDLSLKVAMAGYRTYWTPHCELYHFESKTRISRVLDYEVRIQSERWESALHDSGYWPYELPRGPRI